MSTGYSENSSLRRVQVIADYQFGGAVGTGLFPEECGFIYSTTGRIRQVLLGGVRLATVLASDGRLTGKQGKLHEQQRQAGEAHAFGLAVEPRKGRRAEFENQLVFAELQFHDALLDEGSCLSTCNACANRVGGSMV